LFGIDLSLDFDRTFEAARPGGPSEVDDWIIDLSQAQGRGGVGRGFLPCVTPGGLLWSTKRRRLLVGREKLFGQGIFPKQPMLPGTEQDLESDLAGNAFCTLSYLSVLVALFVSLGSASQNCLIR